MQYLLVKVYRYELPLGIVILFVSRHIPRRPPKKGARGPLQTDGGVTGVYTTRTK